MCALGRPGLDHPVDKTDFAYARGKSHWSTLHLLANELRKMPEKLFRFIREFVMFIFTKSLLFTLWIMFLLPSGALQYRMKWKPTSLGFVQPRISQVLRVHKDLLLDLFSSSAVQMETHSGLFEPNWTSIVWARPKSLTGFDPYGAWTRKSRKSKWGSITLNRSLKWPPGQWSTTTMT